MSNGKAIQDICAERTRQMRQEGFDAAHDDAHEFGELSHAAACYALNAGSMIQGTIKSPYRWCDEPVTNWWPWDAVWWKPKDARRDLVKAAALIVAEIDRMDRADCAVTVTPHHE